MTLLIFLPDDDTILLLDSPLPPEALSRQVASGEWIPPSPYPAGMGWRVARQGRLVVVLPPGSQGLAFEDQASHHRRERTPIPRPLSDRQRQVLRLMAAGLTDRQIAARLRLHPSTVALHIRALKRQLGAATRIQAAARAAQMGLVEEEELRDEK